MTDPKTVVFAIFTLQGGGAEKFVLTLAQAFVQLGYQAHVVAFKKHIDHASASGIHCHFIPYRPLRALPKGRLRYWLAARLFDRHIRRHIGTPDLIVSNLWQVDQILHHSRLPNIVHVLHNTTSLDYQLNSKYPKASIAQLRYVYGKRPLIAVSRGVMLDYQQYIDGQARITTILNPIAREHIRHLAQVDNVAYPSPYLIHVGRFSPQKDHATLLRAYAASHRLMPLLLLGQGKEENNCRRLVQELGIGEQVIFVGFQANPYPLIAHASGFVLSSRYEGFGLVIAESLALGIPVISTDCPSGPNELLPPHCLVPVGDIAALSAKMNELMQELERFKTSFNEDLLPEKVAQRYLDWLQTCPVA
ncbi:glycosyltransferase [Stenoxybacter acetivorans]|uniref:glycosyltransferase n=1 Tax=Stenoxybacter acetivorans TaxID=422441 RepID=UPI0005625F5B|nr:glycosyltransferase [Stenoxybacter acetivorans]